MPRFLTDEMLAGLARWMRAAGHDTATAPAGAADGAIVAAARRDGRLLLTRDRAILAHRAADGIVLLLHGEGMDAWAAELAGRVGVDWLRAPFTRCLLCNGELTPAPAGAAPADAMGPVTWCPCCRKPYWRGGHVRRMEGRLAGWKRSAFR